MRIREYRESDFDAIQNPVESCDVSGECATQNGEHISYTVEDNDVPIMCGGIIYSGMSGYVWLRIGQEAVQKPVRMVRTLRVCLDILQEVMGNPELNAHVLDGFEQGERLARLFGFERTDETLEVKGNLFRTYRRAK